MKSSLLLSLIGKNIKERRSDANLTTRTLAEIAGLSPGQISYMENGLHNVAIVSLEKVANGLECEVGDLMHEIGRSIQRIDDPKLRLVANCVVPLLAQNRMIRKPAANALNDRRLRVDVRITDHVGRSFRANIK